MNILKRGCKAFIVLCIISFCFNCRLNPGSEPSSEIKKSVKEEISLGSLNIEVFNDPYIIAYKPFRLVISLDASDKVESNFEMLLKFDETLVNFEKGSQEIPYFSDVSDLSVTEISSGKLKIRAKLNKAQKATDYPLVLCTFIPIKEGDIEFSLSSNKFFTLKKKPILIPKDPYLSLKVQGFLFDLDHVARGLVLDSIAGSPIAEAKITVKPLGLSTTSKADGTFSISLPEGVYDFVVHKKGRAGACMQSVEVSEEKGKDIVIIQPKYAYSETAVKPPIIALKDIRPYEYIYGIKELEIRGIEGSAPIEATNYHPSVTLYLSLTKNDFHREIYSKNDSLNYSWNSKLFPKGEAFIKIVIFDINSNRSELNVPVKILNFDSPPDVPPLNDYYQVIANTYAESMAYMKSIDSYSNKAPENMTVLVEFLAQKLFNGFVVYKSHNPDGPFQLIGQSSSSKSDQFLFADYGSDLVPGETVYYKLAFYNQYGIGPTTEANRVKILPKYKLHLDKPANGSLINELSPFLSWVCDPPLEDTGASRTDWIIASNIIDATIIAYTLTNDINKCEYKLSDLLYNNTYEWDVRSLYELSNYKDRRNIISRSFPRGRRSNDYSSNGAFTFTIVEAPK